MAIYQRGSGAHVAERVQPEPGSQEEKDLQALADDPASDWRRLEDEKPAEPKKTDDPAGGQGDGPKRPPQSASKDEWVKWAVSQGAEQADADKATKADLIAAYGGE